MTTFCIVLALVAAGMLTEMIAASRAPFGYQDDKGFHFGSDDVAPTAFETNQRR